MVPLNEEAAGAIRIVQTVGKGELGIRDSYTGTVTHYLLMPLILTSLQMVTNAEMYDVLLNST